MARDHSRPKSPAPRQTESKANTRKLDPHAASPANSPPTYDRVEEASNESFPASDPPSFNSTSATRDHEDA